MDIISLSLLAFVAGISSGETKLISLLRDVQKVEQFQSIFILKQSNELFGDGFGENFIKDLSTSLDIPVVLSTDTSPFFIKAKFNNNLLTIVHLNPTSGTEEILLSLLKNLRHMRFCKTIFLLNHPSKDDNILKELFEFCATNDMLNVLAVFRDFVTTSAYYRYTIFPGFDIEENRWTGEQPACGCFPDRMRDHKGRELPVVFGGSEPKMIFAQNKHGQSTIAGYAGHFFYAVAKKHNASLNKPQINKHLSAPELADFVRNRTFEISAATTYPAIFRDWFTYPYESIDSFPLLPIEPNIPIYEIFMIIFQWETLLITIGFIVILSALLESATYLTGKKTSPLNYFINESCLRGALGQSFCEIPNATYNIKFIYLLVCLIGIIMVTSYNAFLQTYMTSPPSEKRIETFDDLLASDMKVYGHATEFNFLALAVPKFRTKYYGMFQLEKSFTRYLKFRDSFNTQYVYMANNVKWIIVQEQQRLFSRPLFRKPEGMFFFKGVPMAFPINENSIYKGILNFAILEVHASGLLEFWKRRSFHELIDAGKLKMVDLTSKPEIVPLTAGDLALVWIGMVVAYTAVTLCFVLEILIFRWKARRERSQREA